ncbi:helix-turn-helix domain-containing protein [Vagococcus fluvialis]|uniref:helix-turn-helix domain-containing protein n=1 Tax=Vagococcus fluvialis TaxID=2738 RepID=UPI003B226A99
MPNVSQSLKFFRESKLLTKKEFCSGIVSASYYSKVENGISNISADLLIRILNKNNISASEFFFRVNNNKELEFNVLYKKIILAYYSQDIEKLLKIQGNIEASDLFFNVLALLIEKTKNEELDIEIQEKLKLSLLNVNNWTEQYILLFTLTTIVLSEKDLFMISSFFIKSISKSNSVEMYEKNIKIAILNIIYIFLKQKMLKEAEYFIIFSDQTFNTPLSLYDRVVLDFYKNFILYLKKEDKNSTYFLEKCKNIVTQLDYYELNYTVTMLENLLIEI